MGQAISQFEQLTREYNYEVQASSAEYLKPFVGNMEALAEFGVPDSDCDSEEFAECLVEESHVGYAIWPD